MFKEAMSQIKTALILLVLLSVITGLIYPLMVTALAQLLFPYQANGSLILQNNRVIGSQYIGQNFRSLAYFWGRPSMTSAYAYNGAASSGSNSGPTNPDFLALVKERISQLKQWHPENNQLTPIDLVTASGSGLDPELSPYAAFYQAARVAKVRQLPEAKVLELINKQIKYRTWGLLGEPRVNVLQLNLALDALRTSNEQAPSKP
ncbi:MULTISPECIES: potassium-transporting ATPase subunit KdpC [Legionella]|uniref:Potassium-transporting ATPase KdpC subunit n=1 Tax=Legionella drozanskii LLAP-1 TaxID=1212489 RepID=A0A0W0TDY1_9GAMM|nr:MULTISPECIES: potassium-transporting ATPase subunit KdpC [Legionella]KTC93750.1 potassium translocating ATPase, subunit C [Legionella drozanskii LLAP-1]PJE13593.1 MAG: potassium-transporting ATPase subunit KdpC [Legionella sp.]